VCSRASAGIASRQAYQVCGHPPTSSSGGPSPPVTACSRSPFSSTSRLVKTSVNPSGSRSELKLVVPSTGILERSVQLVMSVTLRILKRSVQDA